MKLKRSFPSIEAGFSLVEVTLALGIAALGLLAVLGLMPQGMEMSRKTGELSAQRQIVENICRNLEQKTWDELTTKTNDYKAFYDDQGLELENATSPMQALVASVHIVQKGKGGGGEKPPRLPGTAVDEANLVKVVIKIATTTRPDFNFDDSNRRNYVTVVDYIAKAR